MKIQTFTSGIIGIRTDGGIKFQEGYHSDVFSLGKFPNIHSETPKFIWMLLFRNTGIGLISCHRKWECQTIANFLVANCNIDWSRKDVDKNPACLRELAKYLPLILNDIQLPYKHQKQFLSYYVNW